MAPRLIGPRALILAALLVCAPIAPRSEPQQLATVKVAGLIEQARVANEAIQLDQAQARVSLALELAEQTGDRVGLAMAQRMQGTVLVSRGRPIDAVPWYERALANFETLGIKSGVGDALRGLTVAYSAAGDATRTREFGTRAIAVFRETGQHRDRGYTLLTLARYEATSEGRMAIVADVLALAETMKDDELRSAALIDIASHQFTRGEYDASRVSHEKAIEILERGKRLERLAAAYLSLGRVFRAHGDYEGALARYQKAVTLLEKTNERFTIVEALNASGVALSWLGRQKEALAAYERGLALAREGGNARLIDFMLGALATALSSQGDHERAIAMFEEVIARKPDRWLLGYRYAGLAGALSGAGRNDEALARVTDAVAIAREFKQTDVLADRLDGRSEILSRLGRFDEALTDSREVLSIVEQIRTQLIPIDFLRRGYSDRVQKGYLRGVGLLSRLGRGAEALEYAEQGRARAFLDLIAARQAAGAPASVDGSSARDAAVRPLSLAGMRDLAARLQSTLLVYSVHLDETLIWVMRPGGADPVHVRTPVGLDKLAAMVTATTAPFRHGEARQKAASVQFASGGSAADELTALPMRGISVLALTRDDKSAWRALHAALIQPIQHALPDRDGRLTIVPHGPLFRLSFAALQSRSGRYLVEDYDLHYAPAVTALEFTGRRQDQVRANLAGPWAIVGDPARLPQVGTIPLAPLPGAASEMASIASLAQPAQVIRLAGSAADEAAVVRTLTSSRPSVLHFATHGFVFDDPKRAPFLALNRRGAAAGEDGMLTADEVYDLQLETDLVVLSACRTGAGQISSDGIVGLTRGFLYAGTPSVVATFWDVIDEATSVLMTGFYRSYARGRAKSGSLRAAQLALLRDLRAGKVVIASGSRRVALPEHPLLWAAFFLTGEP